MNFPSLQGLNVLVTRPVLQQQSLGEAIKSLGGKAIHFPLIDIVQLAKTEDIKYLENKVRAIDDYQILIFVSANAAQFSKEWFTNCAVKIPEIIKVIAIGPTTARAVSDLFGCTVIHSDVGVTSEDLLSLPELEEIAGKKIGILRGKGGRELLAAELRERGAVVDYFEVYRRKIHAYGPRELIDIVNRKQVNAFTITSGEALVQLSELAVDNKATLSLIPLVVPSARLADQAEKLGYKIVRNSNGADDVSMLATLRDIASDDVRRD